MLGDTAPCQDSRHWKWSFRSLLDKTYNTIEKEGTLLAMTWDILTVSFIQINRISSESEWFTNWMNSVMPGSGTGPKADRPPGQAVSLRFAVCV